MKIWVDADACPKPIRELLFRASARLEIEMCLVANQRLGIPNTSLITSVQVAGKPDEADKHIAEHCAPGDLVVTADIPLAAQIVEKGALALDPRGELYSQDNVQQRLATRNFMQELRSMDVVTGGPAAFKPADKQKFAAALDRLLTKRMRDQR